MKSKKLQYSLLFIFIGLTLTGILGLNLYPSNVVRTTHQVTTLEGDVISFNVYQPKGLTQSTPVVVMGHGVIVNKEMMTTFAIELASAGVIVANLDWNGHGQSTGELQNLSDDLEAVIAAIPTIQPLANMSAMALLGYSMGGFGTYPYAINNSNVKAWVGVGTLVDGDVSNTTNPRNILLIIGSLDESFSPEETKTEFVNLTGESAENIEFEHLYGDMGNGTARKIHIVPGADHLITPWHRDFVVPATEWILTSFNWPQTASPSNAFDVRNVLAWVGFLSLVALVFVVGDILADTFKVRKDEDSPAVVTIDPKAFEETSLLSFIGKYYIITFLLIPTIIIFGPLFLTPLAFTAALTAIVGCFGVNVFIYSWRLSKRWNFSLRSLIKENLSQKTNIWIYSVILTGIFIVGYYLTIGLNYLGMIPATPRILYLVLYCIILFVIIFLSSVFIQKLALPYLKSKLKFKNPTVNYLAIHLIIFLLVDSWFVILIMVPCIIIGNYFIAMILILMIPIFLVMIFFGGYMEKLTGSVIPGTLLHAIMVGFVIVTLSPYGDVVSFLFGILT